MPAQNTLAGDIDEINVTEKSGVYYISISADISASEKYVRQVVSDYAHAYRINNSIIESEILPSPVNGNIRVRAKLLCCTSLFCREAERLDEVSILASGDIQAVIIPEKSDFYSGKAVWKFAPDGGKTHLVYTASIEPSFFIPPLIGPKLVIESLREQFTTTFFRIEQVAIIKEEHEWDDDFQLAKVVKKEPCNNALMDASQ